MHTIPRTPQRTCTRNLSDNGGMLGPASSTRWYNPCASVLSNVTSIRREVPGGSKPMDGATRYRSGIVVFTLKATVWDACPGFSKSSDATHGSPAATAMWGHTHVHVHPKHSEVSNGRSHRHTKHSRGRPNALANKISSEGVITSSLRFDTRDLDGDLDRAERRILAPVNRGTCRPRGGSLPFVPPPSPPHAHLSLDCGLACARGLTSLDRRRGRRCRRCRRSLSP